MAHIRNGKVFSLCVVGFVLAASVFAQGSEVSGPNSYMFDLEYVPSGQSLQVHWLDRVSFEKEPDFGGRKVAKGLIPTGSEEKDYIGYACDLKKGKLYLDLNRNRDLTDDPNGVFVTSEPWKQSYSYGVRFTVESGSLSVP